MGSPSEPIVSADAAPVQEPLEPASTLTENEIEKGTISNEHRTMAGPQVEPPQASPELPEGLSDGSSTCGTAVQCDILLGTTTPSPQHGILGEVSGRKVALDLNETHTISLFGVQSGGKSYTLGTIAEMVALLG